MKKFHMFEIYASEESVYFASTDEKAQEMATKMFLEFQHNDSPLKDSPLIVKFPPWGKSPKVIFFLQKIKLELVMNGWEPFAVTQKGTEINYFFRREETD
jgi:hypothetical protein